MKEKLKLLVVVLLALLVIILAMSVLSSKCKAADVEYPVTVGNDISALRIIVKQFSFGSGFVGVDTSIFTTAQDTSVTISDSLLNLLDYAVLYDGYTDSLYGTSLIPMTIPRIDTLMSELFLWSTLKYSDFKSVTHYNATVDTIVIMNGTDSVGRLLYWHVGGSAGDAPDSVKVE